MRFRQMLLAAAAATLVGASGSHHEEPPPPPKQELRRMERPDDPISSLQGNAAAWEVSDTEAGCYLLSPHRQGSSRFAVGRHPTWGRGLFVIGLGLSTAGMDAPEPLSIRLGTATLAKTGRMPAKMLLFAPLDPPEEDAVLQEMETGGAIWLQVRTTSMAHAGKDVTAALTQYRRACARPG